MKELTDRERIFVLEYLADEKMNAERAAIKAGYSKTVARKKAYSWVGKSGQNAKPQIAELIESIRKKREEELEINELRILNEFARIAFSNLPDILKTMGYEITLKNLGKLNDDQKAAILEVHIDGDKSYIKLHPKNKALESLAKRFSEKKDSSDRNVPRLQIVKPKEQ